MLGSFSFFLREEPRHADMSDPVAFYAVAHTLRCCQEPYARCYETAALSPMRRDERGVRVAAARKPRTSTRR